MPALLLFLLALALLVTGLALVSIPLALVVAGLLMLALAALTDLRSTPATPDEESV